ncbi:MAG: hemerythrin domain-containing protein [Planctomycetota bacterium]|jgi:iron-sulfur cluster repair protein YtfE (RIC family)
MSELIAELKREHSEIVDGLREVKELGVLTKEGKDKLMSIRVTLLKHFEKEDEKFYPILREAAGHNMKQKEVLEVYAKDLENVSEFVFGFFDRFDKGFLGERLSRDFETLFMVVRNRMNNEEDFLFGEYKKIDQ